MAAKRTTQLQWLTAFSTVYCCARALHFFLHVAGLITPGRIFDELIQVCFVFCMPTVCYLLFYLRVPCDTSTLQF